MAVHLPESSYSSEQLAELSQAIQVFERLFPYFDVHFERVINPFGRNPIGKDDSNGATIRDKVVAVTTSMPLTVAEIETQTGLAQKKIRGVLSAPDMVFNKTKGNGETRYQFEKTIPRPNPIPRDSHKPGNRDL